MSVLDTPVAPGDPFRLGAYLRGDGVDVAVLAAHAEAVDLCLIDPDPSAPSGWAERRVPMLGPVYGVWHAHVPGITAGQRYGLRAHGRWDPAAGLRYNPAKLLLDPYTRGVAGPLELRPELYGHPVDDDLVPLDPALPADEVDSLPFAPHSVVLADHPPAEDTRPRVPWQQTVIYEAHVRGLTKLLPGVPEHLRGTYAGLAHPATIEHLRSLGVTTIELLPIHAAVDEPHLKNLGLTNYWGYNTLGFFAPHPGYATAAAQEAGPAAVLDEVRGMVRLLHEAGLEVLLDVVYNHTCEGGNAGPLLSWRGLDNTTYYLHDGGSPARLADVTGCGNAMDFRRTRVVQQALDSLRYWSTQVQVDGFRFDLAVTLGRGYAGFDTHHPLLIAMATDPVLADRKLIAEPWDVGPGGWRTGQFPAPMAEWNDRFRDAARTFWLADPGEATRGRAAHGVRDLATRLSGSADLFGHGDPPLMRTTAASVNFVTAHDGFTLADLTAYEHKHNQANGENNRDGSDNNRSWNHGVEGVVTAESPGMDILPLRRRSMRNLLGTLLLSAGTPMLCAGDELGRTQGGNNNAYCQDNEISWLDWELDPWQQDLLETTRLLLRLRREHPVLHRTEFYTGHLREDADTPDLAWYGPDGAGMTHERWYDPALRTLQMLRYAPAPGDSHALIVLNGDVNATEVTLADGRPMVWELVWDSAWENPGEREVATPADPSAGEDVPAGSTVLLEPLSTRLYLAR